MKYINPLIALFLPLTSFGQLIIGGYNPDDFVASALSSANASVSNVSYTGYNGAICYFSANIQNMSFTSGLLMTTGRSNNAAGPNNASDTYVDNSYSGYTPLNNILGTSTFNASVMSFDVIPTGDTLRIKYIFASEEYPEYVGSQFVDGCAIFISGPGITGTQNIACLPNGASITVNNVNNGNPGNTGSGIGASPAVNPQYFVNNGNGIEAPYNANNTYLQYDGLTIPLTAKSAVTPGQTYHITIAIADAGDAIFDSGVFIEEGGITAGINENYLENFVNINYNPDTYQASIKLAEPLGTLNYSVVDLSGKILTQSTITESTFVDLKNYSSGMYLIRVEGTKGMILKKVIR